MPVLPDWVGTPLGAAQAGAPETTVRTSPALPTLLRPVPPLATATMPVTLAAVPVVFWFRVGMSAASSVGSWAWGRVPVVRSLADTVTLPLRA